MQDQRPTARKFSRNERREAAEGGGVRQYVTVATTKKEAGALFFYRQGEGVKQRACCL